MAVPKMSPPMQQQSSSEARRWLTIVAGMWLEACSGLCYNYSLYSDLLKRSLGYSQLKLNAIASVKDFGSTLGLLCGLVMDLLPTWMVLLVGGLETLCGYGVLWMVVTGAIKPPSFGQMCLVMLLCFNGGAWFDSASVVICLRNFPLQRGPASGLLKSYLGLSGAIFSQIYTSLLAPDQASYLALSAILPILVSLPAMLLLREYPGSTAPREPPKPEAHICLSQGGLPSPLQPSNPQSGRKGEKERASSERAKARLVAAAERLVDEAQDGTCGAVDVSGANADGVDKFFLAQDAVGGSGAPELADARRVLDARGQAAKGGLNVCSATGDDAQMRGKGDVTEEVGSDMKDHWDTKAERSEEVFGGGTTDGRGSQMAALSGMGVGLAGYLLGVLIVRHVVPVGEETSWWRGWVELGPMVALLLAPLGVVLRPQRTMRDTSGGVVRQTDPQDMPATSDVMVPLLADPSSTAVLKTRVSPALLNEPLHSCSSSLLHGPQSPRPSDGRGSRPPLPSNLPRSGAPPHARTPVQQLTVAPSMGAPALTVVVDPPSLGAPTPSAGAATPSVGAAPQSVRVAVLPVGSAAPPPELGCPPTTIISSSQYAGPPEASAASPLHATLPRVRSSSPPVTGADVPWDAHGARSCLGERLSEPSTSYSLPQRPQHTMPGLAARKHTPSGPIVSKQTASKPASPYRNLSLSDTFCSLEFWLLFFALICGCGSGLTAITNLAQMAQSLGNNSPAPLVSLVSLGNFLGRLLAGSITEHLLRTHATPRPAALVAAQAAMAVGHLAFASALPGSLFVGSVIVGVTYGAHWPMMVCLASELFGLQHLGVTYNVLQLASPLGSTVFSTFLAGYLYDREARRGHGLWDSVGGMAPGSVRSGAGPGAPAVPAGPSVGMSSGFTSGAVLVKSSALTGLEAAERWPGEGLVQGRAVEGLARGRANEGGGGWGGLPLPGRRRWPANDSTAHWLHLNVTQASKRGSVAGGLGEVADSGAMCNNGGPAGHTAKGGGQVRWPLTAITPLGAGGGATPFLKALSSGSQPLGDRSGILHASPGRSLTDSVSGNARPVEAWQDQGTWHQPLGGLPGRLLRGTTAQSEPLMPAQSRPTMLAQSQPSMPAQSEALLSVPANALMESLNGQSGGQEGLGGCPQPAMVNSRPALLPTLGEGQQDLLPHGLSRAAVGPQGQPVGKGWFQPGVAWERVLAWCRSLGPVRIEEGQEGWGASEDLVCRGVWCFRVTFLLMACVCGLGMVLSWILMARTRRYYERLQVALQGQDGLGSKAEEESAGGSEDETRGGDGLEERKH